VLTLLKSERFQKEYKDFFDKINAIDDESLKIETSALLAKLVNEVKAFDIQIQEVGVGPSAALGMTDKRNNISELRNQLTRKLNDYATAVKSQ